MAKKGMTPSTVTAAARATRDAAAELESRARTIIDEVQSLDWTGTDAEKYKNDFNTKVTETLQSIVQLANELADEAEKNVTQQEQTSSQ